MTKYLVYLTREQHLKLEIEADSPDEADSRAWDAIDDAVLLDQPTEIDFVQDEKTRQMYQFGRRGKYEPVG